LKFGATHVYPDIATAMMGRCPFYSLFGISTRGRAG
jgi:hypothetical protein